MICQSFLLSAVLSRCPLTLSWMSSNFFASSSSCGMPFGSDCALSSSFHNWRQNGAASLSRKPEMSVWICLMFGLSSSQHSCVQPRICVHPLTNLPASRKVKIISVTTSSSLLRMRVISSATHFLMTGRLTLEMLTFLLNSSGHLVVRIARASAPVCSAADMFANVCSSVCRRVVIGEGEGEVSEDLFNATARSEFESYYCKARSCGP